MTDFATNVVLFMIMKFHSGFAEAKRIAVVAWSVYWENGVRNMQFDPMLQPFRKYDPPTDYCSSTKIERRRCCDEKHVLHPY